MSLPFSHLQRSASILSHHSAPSSPSGNTLNPNIHIERSSSPVEMATHDKDTDLSSLVLGLKIENSSLSQKIDKLNEITAKIQAENADIKQSFQEQLNNIHLSINTVNNTADQHIKTVEAASAKKVKQLEAMMSEIKSATSQQVSNCKRDILDVPIAPHVFFTGHPKETYQFIFFIQEALISASTRFADEKQKITWIASFFHAERGHVTTDPVPSHNWWRGLLSKNAAAQSLPTVTASSHAPYVIPKLQSAKAFIAAMESTFASHQEAEDSQAALHRLRQSKDQTIEEFNIIFNALLFQVELDQVSQCEIYSSAINPIICGVGTMRGGWSQIKTLQEKQRVAIIHYHDNEGMRMVEQMWSSQKQIAQVAQPPPQIEHKITPYNQTQATLALPQSRQRESSPGGNHIPMELDALATELKFTYAAFQILCKKNTICHQCGKTFNRDHICAKVCPIPKDSWMTWQERFDLFKKMGANNPKQLQESMIKGSKENKKQDEALALQAAVAETSLIHDTHTSKKQACDSPLPSLFLTDAIHASKIFNLPTSIITNPIVSASSAEGSQAFSKNLFDPSEPMNLADQLLDAHLAEMDDCKHVLISSSSDKQTRPFFAGFVIKNDEKFKCSVLIDSSASSSFINREFVDQLKLCTSLLANPIQCKGFDGTLASTGDITNCVETSLLIPTSAGKFLSSMVSLNVTKLVSADIILGSPWLQLTNTFVGGKKNQIYVQYEGCDEDLIANVTLLDEKKLTEEFEDVLVTEALKTLPPHRKGFDFEINLEKDAVPPFGKVYNLSKEERDQLKAYVDINLKKGFIRVSSSSAAAPIFYVKVDGKADRPCVDYRLLNDMTIRDSYPLPVISHLLNNLQGCQCLSKINLKAAFNLLRVAPGHKWKTAFRTPEGLYEYKVMPFGLANAPATFQRFIQHVLREYLDVFCFVYIDDILIFSKNREDHLFHLQKILKKLQEFSLKASLNKWQFFQTDVTFLGFDISTTGIKMNDKKLKTILNWLFPSNLKEIQRFLGFTNFYRRFIPNFSRIAEPLTALKKID
jgi:hypothetical protein